MKRLCIALGAVLVLTAINFAGVPASTTTPATPDTIIALENKWLDAEMSADHQALNDLIAEDFMGNAGGTVLGKGDVDPGAEDRPRFPKSKLEDPHVKIFGDTAVLMGTVRMEQSALRVTTVYMNRAGRWQMVAAHLSSASQK